jgi:hypothetical protein
MELQGLKGDSGLLEKLEEFAHPITPNVRELDLHIGL